MQDTVNICDLMIYYQDGNVLCCARAEILGSPSETISQFGSVCPMISVLVLAPCRGQQGSDGSQDSVLHHNNIPTTTAKPSAARQDAGLAKQLLAQRSSVEFLHLFLTARVTRRSRQE